MERAADGETNGAPREGGDARREDGEQGVEELRRLREAGLPQTVLAALVAWSVTLAPAAFSRSSPGVAVAIALAALLAGLGGPLLITTRPRLSRFIGISLFLSLAVVTWLVASPSIQPGRMDPLRAAIGAVAWGVFALSWNERWTTKATVDADPQAPALPARATLPRLAVPIAAVGVVGALTYIALAWRVRDADRALMAQAVALICAVALVTAAATVSIARGKRHVGGSGRVTSQALRSLILLVTLAVAGAVIIALR